MQIYSVNSLNRYIKQIMDANAVLQSVYVRGEISNFKRHYSGHCYFTLKDNDAAIKCVMFRHKSQYLKFEPHNGIKVVVGGQVTVFERDGQYQLYAELMMPEGLGELSLAYAQLKEKLAAEGLFDAKSKKDLPLLPQRVGVVTSPTGAALYDIITVAKRRYPGVEMLLCPVQVQGPEAPAQIASAIQMLNKHGQADVIIVGRGGGSMEELWAFNEEIVVRAIAASAIPVVSAVGHETDVTLADFAADRRAATPSQAAEIVVPDISELRRRIVSLQTMMETLMRTQVKDCCNRAARLLQSPALRHPLDMLAAKQQTVDALRDRLIMVVRQRVKEERHAFWLAAQKLSVLNPLAVLARGYSITRTADGSIVTGYDQIKPQQEIDVVLSKGSVLAKVLTVKEDGVTHG